MLQLKRVGSQNHQIAIGKRILAWNSNWLLGMFSKLSLPIACWVGQGFPPWLLTLHEQLVLAMSPQMQGKPGGSQLTAGETDHSQGILQERKVTLWTICHKSYPEGDPPEPEQLAPPDPPAIPHQPDDNDYVDDELGSFYLATIPGITDAKNKYAKDDRDKLEDHKALASPSFNLIVLRYVSHFIPKHIINYIVFKYEFGLLNDTILIYIFNYIIFNYVIYSTIHNSTILRYVINFIICKYVFSMYKSTPYSTWSSGMSLVTSSSSRTFRADKRNINLHC